MIPENKILRYYRAKLLATPPEAFELSSLDNQMSKILTRTDLDTKDKALRYYKTLSKFKNLYSDVHRKFEKPKHDYNEIKIGTKPKTRKRKLVATRKTRFLESPQRRSSSEIYYDDVDDDPFTEGPEPEITDDEDSDDTVVIETPYAKSKTRHDAERESKDEDDEDAVAEDMKKLKLGEQYYEYIPKGSFKNEDARGLSKDLFEQGNFTANKEKQQIYLGNVKFSNFYDWVTLMNFFTSKSRKSPTAYLKHLFSTDREGLTASSILKEVVNLIDKKNLLNHGSFINFNQIYDEINKPSRRLRPLAHRPEQITPERRSMFQPKPQPMLKGKGIEKINFESWNKCCKL